MAVSFKSGKDRVHSPETAPKQGRSAVLYGPPFSGKTSTLQYDKSIRVLLVDLDKNSGVVEKEENVDIIGCDSFDDYLDILTGIESGAYKIGNDSIAMDYDLYVIDSFTRLEELIKQWVVSSYAPKRSREIKEKFGAQTDWNDLQEEEIRQFRYGQALTRRISRPINILWIGHDMEAKDSSDFQKKITLKLQGKFAAPGIMSAADGIFYMVKQPNPDEKSPIRQLFGIQTIDLSAGNVTYQASMRVPARDRMKLPSYIQYPKWGEVFKMLGATNLPDTSPSN